MIADHVFHIIFLGKVGSRGIAEKKQEKGEIVLRELRPKPTRSLDHPSTSLAYRKAFSIWQRSLSECRSRRLKGSWRATRFVDRGLTHAYARLNFK